MSTVSINDYEVEGGFNGSDVEGQQELLKAMTAGQITGRDTTNQSLTQEPLKAESLEKTLKLLEFRTKDIRLWNAVPKMTAYNTVEEFLQLQSYGAQRGGFYNEGELSDVEDSTYIRRAELVKYMQVTGEVTMQAQMVRSFYDAMKKETENKMQWILRLANSSLTKADSNIVPQQFNSFYKQHASIGSGNGFLWANSDAYFNSPQIVDMRGKSLKQIDVEKGSVIVDDNYGTATDIFAPTSILSTLSQDYFETQRILQNGSGVQGKFGTVVKSISTTLGDVNLTPDKFMKRNPAKTTASPADSTKAPAAPTADGVTPIAVTTVANSKFITAEAGNAYYAVAAVNRYGESALTVMGAAAAIAATKRIDVKFTAGNGANAATGYTIYRTKITAAGSATGLDFFPIFSISEAERAAGYNSAGAGIVGDLGYYLPDCEEAFITQFDEEVLSFKQLAPISKLDLAVIAMARRFIVFLFGTPNLYAPKKFVKYINCAKVLTNP